MNKVQNKIIFAVLLIVFACSWRVVQANYGMYNLSPVAATALFLGALFGRRYAAFLIPLAVQFVSDFVVNTFVYHMENPLGYYFTWEAVFVYPCYILIALLGSWVGTKGNYVRVPVGALAASAWFFIITNFGAWVFDPMYTKNWAGLNLSYAAGLEFYQNTWVGDLVFSALFFGTYYFAQRFVVSARTQKA